MSLHGFFSKQLIDVIQWTEGEEGELVNRFPMLDLEIQNGARLTVRESQMAVFVNEGRIADVFGPGLYTLNTQNLPVLTDLNNWDKGFESPFKSDVYFFSTRLQMEQKWGTSTPISIRDQEFGAIRLRGYGIYSWHLKDPRVFHSKVSGTRDGYRVADIEGQLRNTIVSHIADGFANSSIPFLDMTANQTQLAARIAEKLKPYFAELGLALDSFIVDNLSLPEELQKSLDARIGMNIVGDLGRFTQFEAARSLPIAAANEGGGGAGMTLGAGMAMGQQILKAFGTPAPENRSSESTVAVAEGTAPTSAPTVGTKFCIACGKSISRNAKFCPECGGSQQ